jgi:hypothetical protein
MTAASFLVTLAVLLAVAQLQLASGLRMHTATKNKARELRKAKRLDFQRDVLANGTRTFAFVVGCHHS